MSLGRNVFTQAALTGLSKVLGFARDTIIIARIGAGAYGDVWATAQQLPNLFRRILAEGAFSQAFSPLYARTRVEQGDAEAQRIASETMSVLFSITMLVTVVMQLSMPLIMPVLLAAYRDKPDIFNLAILASQITMPYLIGMALSALFAGVLNAASRFALSAFAPTLLNISILVSAVIFSDQWWSTIGASIAVMISGFLQAWLLWWGMKRQGIHLRLMWPKLTPDVKRVIMIAVPGSISASMVQVNILISSALAGMEVGAKSWLSYADRLYQLPLGMIGVAVSIAILPRMARAAAGKGDVEAGSRTMDEGLAFSMAFTLPAAAALVTIHYFLVDALFVRGHFYLHDALMTADVLFWYGWGVPAFVLAKVLTTAFFARQDTKRPMQYALISVGINIVVGAGGFLTLKAMDQPGAPALAFATTLAAWINVLQMWLALRRLDWYRPSASFWFRMTRILIASAIGGAVLAGFQLIRGPMEAVLFGSKEIAIAITIAVGGIVYVVAAFALGAVSVKEIKGMLSRPAKTEPAPPAASPGE